MSDGTIAIDVLLFGPLADDAKAPSVRVTVPSGGSVADVVAAVAAQHPRLRAGLASAAVAVNLAYAAPTAVVGPRDAVALIPPVSGG